MEDEQRPEPIFSTRSSHSGADFEAGRVGRPRGEEAPLGMAATPRPRLAACALSAARRTRSMPPSAELTLGVRVAQVPSVAEGEPTQKLEPKARRRHPLFLFPWVGARERASAARTRRPPRSS